MKHHLPFSFASPWALAVAFWLLLGPCAYAQAPAWQTAAAAAGTVAVQATAPAADGNSIYLAGGFSGTATFGSIVLNSATAQQVFVAKWSLVTNSFVWA
ncbi:MAG: hypothetical protein EOO36_16700, partial [Cytophagaceae bacterium]